MVGNVKTYGEDFFTATPPGPPPQPDPVALVAEWFNGRILPDGVVEVPPCV